MRTSDSVARRVWRIAIVLVALFAMLGVSAAASSPEHLHAKAPASGCDICFLAHTVSSEARAAVQLFRAPELRRYRTTAAAPNEYRLVRAIDSSTRGPPSFAP